MTFKIMTLSIIRFSYKIIDIRTFSIITLSITAFIMSPKNKSIQDYGTLHNDIRE